MPNHLTTICTVTGEPAAIDAFSAAVFRTPDGSDSEVFDFAAIVPKPAIVDKTESGSEADNGFFALTGLHHVKFAAFGENPMQAAIRHGRMPDAGRLTTVEDYREWLEKTSPDAIEKGKLQLQCFRETGHLNWYDWNIANWGTKWGAYSYSQRFREPAKLVFKFETAWSFPEPIFEALTKQYPALTFDVVTIDEGGPEYEGRYSANEQSFARVEHTAERYRAVYGHDPYSDDDDDDDEEVDAVTVAEVPA